MKNTGEGVGLKGIIKSLGLNMLNLRSSLEILSMYLKSGEFEYVFERAIWNYGERSRALHIKFGNI